MPSSYLPAQKSIFDFNPDNSLGGVGAYASAGGRFAAIFAACSGSIDRLWTSPDRQNCLATCLTIVSRPNGLSGFKLNAVVQHRICNWGLVFAMLRDMLLGGFREREPD